MRARGTFRIIRADHLVRKPWRNGGGSTAEIAVHPARSGFDDFAWRISMADVESCGPFSAFPGVDRTLVLLHGDGIVLYVGGERQRLDIRSPLARFSGDATTTGTLTGGPIRDFNVMTRRDRYRHHVDWIDSAVLEIDAETLLLATLGPCAVTAAQQPHRLGRLDAILATPPYRVAVEGRLLRVRLMPVKA